MVSDPPADAIAAGSMIECDRTWDRLAGMAISIMDLYSRLIFPRLCDWSMRNPRMACFRREMLAEARGEILEIIQSSNLDKE